MCGKYFKIEKEKLQNTLKKKYTFVKDIKIPDIFLQNPKVPNNVMGFSNHAQRFTEHIYLSGCRQPLHTILKHTL